MKKLDRHAATYLSMCLTEYTIQSKEYVEECEREGKIPLFTKEFLDNRRMEIQKELDRVTKKKYNHKNN